MTQPSPNGKIAIITVGLPATGKTFIARYLRWIGVNTRTFSVAKYRKSFIGEKLRAEFFDPSTNFIVTSFFLDNKEALEKRTEIANKALNDMVKWFEEGGQVGVLDATNITKERRQFEYNHLSAFSIQVIFLECIYANDDNISEHIRDLRMTCPEYEDCSAEEAQADFIKRIDFYRPNYETLQTSDPFAYIQLKNGGEKIITKGISGYLPTRIVYFLMNLQHSRQKAIYLSTHIDDNLMEYASRVGLIVWTGTQGDAGYTVSKIRPQLDAIMEGEVEGLSEEQLQAGFPEDYEKHKVDPYGHRYPRAESYRDLSGRLEGIIMELEKMNSKILIVAHESVLRCIYAYYVEMKPKEIPSIPMPKDMLIELIPNAYGCFESRSTLDGKLKLMESTLRSYQDIISSP